MQIFAAATSPGNFIDNPPVEQSPDCLSVAGPHNSVIRLPAYSKDAISVKLAQTAQFEIKAQSLFPNLDHGLEVNRLLPRFGIRVVKSGRTVSVAGGCFFEPFGGWLSFLPLFLGIPFSFYFAPPASKLRQTTASIGG